MSTYMKDLQSESEHGFRLKTGAVSKYSIKEKKDGRHSSKVWNTNMGKHKTHIKFTIVEKEEKFKIMKRNLARLTDCGVKSYEDDIILEMLECIKRYISAILLDAQAYSIHAQKRCIDFDDIKLAVNLHLKATDSPLNRCELHRRTSQTNQSSSIGTSIITDVTAYLMDVEPAFPCNIKPSPFDCINNFHDSDSLPTKVNNTWSSAEHLGAQYSPISSDDETKDSLPTKVDKTWSSAKHLGAQYSPISSDDETEGITKGVINTDPYNDKQEM